MQKSPKMLRRGIILGIIFAIGGCASDKPELPPLPPEASLCTFYTPWQMSPEPARLETVDKLRTHAGNNAAHYEKCVTNHPALDPKRSGGPR
jgi:hypothetical protein